MSTDTGAALAAAIRAAPDDDAPWLVYADWLQEAGRDAEAQVIRADLPALRWPVRSGHEVTEVVAAAAVFPPGSHAFETIFGRPPAETVEFPAQLPTWPEPVSLRVERPAERHARPNSLPVLFVGVVLMTVVRAGLNRPDPQPVLSKFPTEAIRPAESPGPTLPPAWAKSLTVPTRPAALHGPARWERSDVAGYTFRRVDGEDEDRTFIFRGDGTAEVFVTRRGHPAVRLTPVWSIDTEGGIDIGAPPSGQTPASMRRLTQLILIRELGSLYEVQRDGRMELY